MGVSRRNPWLSVLLVTLGMAWLASYPARVWAADGPEPWPTVTPSRPVTLPTAQPASSPETNVWDTAALAQPADAFADPYFWAVMALVVLGHFVLTAEFRQGGG